MVAPVSKAELHIEPGTPLHSIRRRAEIGRREDRFFRLLLPDVPVKCLGVSKREKMLDHVGL